ncbi:hypothetical protein [Bacteroides fragilis]|uniref:hypothetical protein n=1 Tax=Bacteroides fragilis TaxID=817 RepID=UPI001C702529|nr:hypothetical protein [Bacteroides fragilis]MBW9280235.1 hypothetical protein [Bacteroides fragilis]
MNNIMMIVFLAGEARSTINEVLSDWGVTIIGATVLLGLANGLVKNWDNINDTSGTGRKKEGIQNVIYSILYALLILVVLGVAVAAVQKLKLSV